jgi:CheY-like chemotaxis protein
MKLLLADDMKAFLDLTRTFLRRADCQIATAATGLEALKVAKRFQPHLILLDVEMPEMTGIEATRILKSTPGLKEIPVVILSGNDHSAAALASGAAEFVRKPLDEGAFLQLVTRYIPLRVRKDPRRPLEAPCVLTMGRRQMVGTVMDLSASGLFLVSDHRLEIGDRLALRFTLPRAAGPVEIRGEAMVVRKAPPRGYGLGFSDLSEGAVLLIREFTGG